MASLQCGNCKYGIHYHDEPSGIEYVMIAFSDWAEITAAKFDPEKKILDKTGYPKLYRTDTIEEDFPGAVKKFWKCPKCGTLFFFDENGKVITSYIPDTDSMPDIVERDWMGICFDDYQWGKLTEAALYDEQLPEKVKNFYKIYISEDELALKHEPGGKMTKYNRIV